MPEPDLKKLEKKLDEVDAKVDRLLHMLVRSLTPTSGRTQMEALASVSRSEEMQGADAVIASEAVEVARRVTSRHAVV